MRVIDSWAARKTIYEVDQCERPPMMQVVSQIQKLRAPIAMPHQCLTTLRQR